jgi:heat shock protein HslJ
MNRVKFILLVCTFLLAAINSLSCNQADETSPSPLPSPSDTQVSPKPPFEIRVTALPGTRWVVISVNGTALDNSTDISLDFSDSGTFRGDVLCNNYGGKYTISDNNTLKMTDVILTLLLCNIGNQDQGNSYLQTLSLVLSYKITKYYLVFLGKDDKELIILQLPR